MVLVRLHDVRGERSNVPRETRYFTKPENVVKVNGLLTEV